MNQNINVVDKNGNNIVAEGIACIQFISSGKKYVLYTLNEKVENDLTKMYVGEIGTSVGELEKVSDDEWMHIKTTLNGITHGEENPDLKYIDFFSLPLNIGIPKKLAIKQDVKQAFMDKYNQTMLNKKQGNSDGTGQTSSSSGFFNSDVVDAAPDTPAVPVPEASEATSIFENPLKPDLSADTVEPAPAEPAADITPTSEPETVTSTEPAATPTLDVPAVPVPEVPDVSEVVPEVTAPVQDPASTDSTSETDESAVAIPNEPIGENANPAVQDGNVEFGEVSAIPEVENPVVEDLSSEVMNSINESLAPEPTQTVVEEVQEDSPDPVSLAQVLPTSQIEGIGIKQDVTKEEALAALEIINKYISQSGGTVNNLTIENNTKITQPNEEVSVPNIQVVENPNEESVVPTSELSQVMEIPSADALSNNEEKIENVDVSAQTAPETLTNQTEAVPEITVPTIDSENLNKEENGVTESVNAVEDSNSALSVEPSIPDDGGTPTVLVDVPQVDVTPSVDTPTPPSVENTESAPEPNQEVAQPTNTPELIPTIDLSEVENKTTAESSKTDNKFINMGVDEINSTVETNSKPDIEDAVKLTENDNLINLDALQAVPEINIPEVPEAPATPPISNAYVNSDPSGIPITLPNNYNSNVATDPSSVLGPGSLPVDNN